MPRLSMTTRLALVFKAPEGSCVRPHGGVKISESSFSQGLARGREPSLFGQGVTMRREGARYFHRTVLGALLYSLTYDMSLWARSSTDVKIPRVITAR